MNKKEKGIEKPLAFINGLFIASIFAQLAIFRFQPRAIAADVVFILASLLTIVLPILLLAVVWWGVSTTWITKMEAWWWLSVPYAAAFPIGLLVFRMWEFGHPLAPYFLLWFVTTASSAIWMLARLYQLVSSPSSKRGAKDTVMLGSVILVGTLLIVLIIVAKSPSR